MLPLQSVYCSLWDANLPHFPTVVISHPAVDSLKARVLPAFSFCHFIFQGWGNVQHAMQRVLFSDVLHCIRCSLNNQRLTASLCMPGTEAGLCICNEGKAEPAPLGSSSTRKMAGVILPWLTFIHCWKALEFPSIFTPQRKRKSNHEQGLFYSWGTGTSHSGLHWRDLHFFIPSVVHLRLLCPQLIGGDSHRHSELHLWETQSSDLGGFCICLKNVAKS